jgi:hypothetical protein
MPRPTAEMQQLARRGAEIRLRELAAEIATIRGAFPDIRKRTDVPLPRAEKRKKNGDVPKKVRKRSGWSASARKAVSLRMKKYWAAKRKTAKE